MAKIGVFDSGYGGLTILEAIRKELPQYDYLYLGDNARAPYGTHSFDVIYRYTLQAVKYLFSQDCALVWMVGLLTLWLAMPDRTGKPAPFMICSQ